jgi:hypothetical protein
MTPELDPNRISLEPERAALAILDAALMATRAALVAQHPEAAEDGFVYGAPPMPPILLIALLVVDRTNELRGLLARYRFALDECRADCARQTEFPF